MKSNSRVKAKIRCIFLAEFHPVQGPQIRYQVPENYVSREIFNAVNVYIIPKPAQLQRSTITLNARVKGLLDIKILGYPVKINSQKYIRHAFYFNLCFVCDSWVRSYQFEPIVRKLSEFLVMMEDETDFLSSDEDDKKNLFYKLFDKVITDLNNNSICNLCEFENTIHLKIVDSIKIFEEEILDYTVPLLVSKYITLSLEEWDLTTQQILPYINGINHVSRIARCSDVEATLVKKCIQNLKYYDAIELFPVFKYCNVYMCTQNLKFLTKNSQLHLSCKKYVSMNANNKLKPSLKHIFEFYASFTHGITLKAICQRFSPQNNNIDERKLVIFGLQQNIIRSIHKYPIYTGSNIQIPIDSRRQFMNGYFSLDEICCKLELPLAIEHDIETDPNITVICK